MTAMVRGGSLAPRRGRHPLTSALLIPVGNDENQRRDNRDEQN
jgi:hypothetical protein